jgi:hypothetical protein
MTDELEDAWEAVHAATPDGWYVGRPSEQPERQQWAMFAFDTPERAIEGKREGKREGEWTTVGPSELEVVRSMGYCLRELGAGRWPK